MNSTKIISGFLALTMASVALYAAPAIQADHNKPVTKAEALAKADEHFAKLDVNADGKLDTADKAAMVKKHFAAMDADKNGAITEQEFVAAHEARATKRDDRRKMRMGQAGPDGMEHRGRGGHNGRHAGRHGGMKMLAMADTNGDKAISKSEFRAVAEARFAKADANSDGTISADERKAQRNGKWGERPATPAPDAG